MSSPTPSGHHDSQPTLNVARVHSATARENPDHGTAGASPSQWVSLLAVIVTLFGGAYAGAHWGWSFNKDGAAYAPEWPQYEGPGGGEGAYDPIKAGERIYKNKCVGCHQVNGLGQPGLYPPLDGSEWVTGSDERLAAIVVYGLQGPITVKGASYPGTALMPAHGPHAAGTAMSPKDIAAVLSYVRNGWSNKGTTVAPEGIADLISRNAGRTDMFTAAEIEAKIPADKMLPNPAATAAPTPAAAPAPAPATN